MRVIDTTLQGLKLIEPQVFADQRGLFFESFNQKKFLEATGIDAQFVQDNHSLSLKGVLRGMHYQLPPYQQAKLIRVVSGSVFDVAVDLRSSSATFGQWHGEILTAENRKQLWIPEGFAHGFLSLSDRVEFLYKTTCYWEKSAERTLQWDCPEVGIAWPLSGESIILSEKDLQGVSLFECKKEIELSEPR